MRHALCSISRGTLAEHFKIKISAAKSRRLAGLSNMIWAFETTSIASFSACSLL